MNGDPHAHGYRFEGEAVTSSDPERMSAAMLERERTASLITELRRDIGAVTAADLAQIARHTLGPGWSDVHRNAGPKTLREIALELVAVGNPHAHFEGRPDRVVVRAALDESAMAGGRA